MGTPAPDSIKRLVDLSACNAQANRFDRNRRVYLSADYKEGQLRAEFGQRVCRLRFHNPFSTAVGWDMDKALT